MIFNLVVLIFVFLTLIFLYRRSILLFVCLMPFIVQYVWMFMSILIIENEIYVSEQDRYGSFVFANFYLLIYWLFTLVSFALFFKLFNSTINFHLPRIKFLKFLEPVWLRFIAFGIITLALINLGLSPSTYTSDEVTKFTFWNTARLPFLKPILGNTLGFFPFILGILFRRYKKSTILLIVLYVFYLVGIDQKFTAFLFGAIAFFVSYIIVNNLFWDRNLFKIKKRYLIISVGLLFSLVLYKYSVKNHYAHLGFTPLESVAYRTFGLQGHLFWGTSERYVTGNENHTWDLTELPMGMHILMEDFTPIHRKKYLNELWERGVSWTNGYPAILNRIFPIPLALIFHFFAFSFVAFCYVLLFKALRKGNFLFAVVFFQICLWLFNTYSMSYFFRLGKIAALIVILCLISLIFKKHKNAQIKGSAL